MPLGTQAPNIYPANKGPHTSTGAKYTGMEARADKILNFYLIERQDDFTIVAAAPSVDDVAFEADATHTIAIGDMVEMYEDDVYFQALVTNVAVDTITVDTPIPYAFTVAGCNGFNGPRNAGVDGSGAGGVTYEIAPPSGQVWDITRLTYYIEDSTAAMTHSLFGNIAALTNGVVLRVKRSASKYEVIQNIKANVDLMVDTDGFVIRADMTAADFGLTSVKEFGNEANSGAMIRLDGSLGESLELVVRDDVSTIDLFKAKVQGYFLDAQ